MIGATAIAAGCTALVALSEDPTALAALWAVVAHHTADGTGAVWRFWSAIASISVGTVLTVVGRAPQVGGWLRGWSLHPDVSKTP